MSSLQYAEVTGIVTSVTFPKSNGDPTLFNIRCPNMNKTFNAICDFYCPIRTNDIINALCAVDNKEKLHLVKPPFVQPPIDKDSTIQCFMRVLKQGYSTALKIYSKIATMTDTEAGVIDFLTNLAQKWNDTRDADLLFMFNGVDHEKVKTLLNWWHRERNVRRLYLLGLTKKEINSCRLTCDEIYEKCVNNPYTVPGIPIEKCDDIMSRLNKSPDVQQRLQGSIIRIIWNNLHKSGWTATPVRYIAKQFPTFYQHSTNLTEKYGMVTEYDCAYLQFPHKVETWLSNFMINIRSEDKIKYDTPLDEIITLEDGSIINRLKAHYTRELSEDQMMAIQGALDHNVSVITGPAGTGKCLAFGTPILMFDGSVKKVEDIKQGDYIMGPDSRPRNVLSTCIGYNDLYEIIPDKGRQFTCNLPHILTLKHRDDVIDIPLHKFIKLPTNLQQEYKLFHVKIDFTEVNILHSDITIVANSIGDYIRLGSTEYDRLIYDAQSDSVRIPKRYIINSMRIRCEFLNILFRHMINTLNGEYHCNARNSHLASDIEYLCLSVGIMVDRRDNILLIGGSLERSFTIKQVEKGYFFGFELDGDGRFLLGDFLVTHNTTCLGQIVHNLEIQGISYAVCAFTGKAVARIREVTKKRNPSTIHRLISNTRKSQLHKRSTQFEKDIPLSVYDHIIIDEASMVTCELLYDFFNAYPNVKKLTFIGDVNQLQPIGWGRFFYQIVKSETIPTYCLTTNYRVYTSTGDRDGIILNANAIITHNDKFPFEYQYTSNFKVIEGPVERVYDIIKACFSSSVKADQLVVVTPYNRYLDQINKEFQDIYNIGARSRTDSRGIKWMIGDRVMLTENDQEIGVFNGECGTIIDMTSEAILVEFPNSSAHEFLFEPSHDNRLSYPHSVSNRYSHRNKFCDDVMDGDEGDADDERTVKRLIHSYAISVDKSQGSEWDFVIFFIPEINTGSFLNKNRIYTAITRAKRCCWCIVSDIELFSMASIKQAPYKCENLSRRLSSILPNVKPYKIKSANPELEMEHDIPDDDYYDDQIDYDDYE